MMEPLIYAQWITAAEDMGEVCPVFRRRIPVSGLLTSAILTITSLGVYEAAVDGKRVGDFFLAPGWTAYNKRLQVQSYDITSLIHRSEAELTVMLGKGWYMGLIASTIPISIGLGFEKKPLLLVAAVDLQYADGTSDRIVTDSSWEYDESPIRFCDLYDGEIYDARSISRNWKPAAEKEYTKDILIPTEGSVLREMEELQPVSLLITPMGETVLDFGQNIAGYVRFHITGAQSGAVAELSFAEILDHQGNFYNENMRGAKNKIFYTCAGGEEIYAPHFSFQGFRYIRIDRWPGAVRPENFTAVVVYSDMERTGTFECSDPLVNQLYSNVIWGQKSNFLDVPTDCPQRDERLGWTGDIQVFTRTAAYNFSVEKFLSKWLHDLAAEQFEDGGVPHIVPNVHSHSGNSAAWGDVAVVCPWLLYVFYGNTHIIEEQFESMRGWVEFIRCQGENEALWNTGDHFGDWLSMDIEGTICGDTAETARIMRGGTDPYLIATAFYANSTSILIKAGKVLGKDMSEYESLYKRIVFEFRKVYIKNGKLTFNTQTAHALTLVFDLAPNRQEIADNLAQLVRENGNRLTTGFVGTPHLLHALRDNGYGELACSLLLQQEFPSWMYAVNQGATTIWEHWDGLREDGTVWDPFMNSFNHYAYGSVADFMYGDLAGICPDEEQPGFRHINFRPLVDTRFSYVRSSIKTMYGIVRSQWETVGKETKFHFEVPKDCTATFFFDGKATEIKSGSNDFTCATA